VLIHFLNDVLNQGEGSKQIIDVTFIKPPLDAAVRAQKQSIIDVLCIDESGDKYLVEMQVAKVGCFEKRAQYYAAKVYCSNMNAGGEYADLKRVIFLAVTDFILFPDKKGI
jgi:predicted transposase/invertase (TIGR01784 family)